MRIFKEFPADSKCIICGKNDNKECTLVALDGTQNGHNEEAIPVHIDCIYLRTNTAGDGHFAVLYQQYNVIK